jgi:hypothetical protein
VSGRAAANRVARRAAARLAAAHRAAADRTSADRATPRPDEAGVEDTLELLPSLACTSAWGMWQSGRVWQGSRAGRRAACGACAPLHVEEELAVRRRQLEDDVVRRDRQECPSRFTTSFRRQKCSAKAGLGLDHEHALEVLTHVRARSWDESP